MDDGYDFTTSGIQKRVQKLRDERDEERQENGRLRAKVAKLERENARLKEQSLPFSMPRIRAVSFQRLPLWELLSKRNAEINPTSSG